MLGLTRVFETLRQGGKWGHASNASRTFAGPADVAEECRGWTLMPTRMRNGQPFPRGEKAHCARGHTSCFYWACSDLSLQHIELTMRVFVEALVAIFSEGATFLPNARVLGHLAGKGPVLAPLAWVWHGRGA